jgi:hypothetical protein
MVGEPILSPDEVRVELVRAAPRAHGYRHFEGEAESLTLVASFQSNDRLRVKVGQVRGEVTDSDLIRA